jgi:small subunit ribosomal protein S7
MVVMQDEPSAVVADDNEAAGLGSSEELVLPRVKLYGKYDCAEVRVVDVGLQEYINISSVYIPFTAARHTKKRFWKRKLHIVERLINKMGVAGHSGASGKHMFTSGRNTGKKIMLSNVIEKAFSRIYEKTQKNPVQVLVDAIENAAPRGEVTSVVFGGVRRPVAVDTSPQRRLDLALSSLSKSIFSKSHGNKKALSDLVAEELLFAASNDPKSSAIEKRINAERQAEASR